MTGTPSLAFSKIVVTGAAGWLGGRFVHTLRTGLSALGMPAFTGPVRALVAPSEPTRDLLALGCEVVAGDLRDPDSLIALLRDGEGALVVHLAGVIHPPGRAAMFEAVNRWGTMGLATAAMRAGVARLVVMSSNSPFGANRSVDDTFDESSPYNPYMGYGRSKWLMERDLFAFRELPAAPQVVIVRSPWFYGPGQPSRQTLFFSLIREGRFPLLGSGANRRSMGYIDNLAQGLCLSSAVPEAAGQVYWVADETPYAMSEIVTTVKTVLAEDFGMTVSDKTTRLPAIVADVARVADRMIQKVGFYHQKIHVLSEMNLTIACNVARAKRELGYRPGIALREGMRRSVEWCLANGHKI